MLTLHKPGSVPEGTVLERRVVKTVAGGNRMEWRRVATEKAVNGLWKPFLVDQIGQVIEEPAFMPLPGSQTTFLTCPIFEALYEGTRGPGKEVLNTNKVLTDSGWKLVGDVQSNDRLVAPDGTYTEIKGIYPQGIKSIYRFTFDDYSTLDVGLDHLWNVRSAKNSSRDGWIVRSTAELIELLKQSEGKTRAEKNSWYIPTMTGYAPGATWSGLDPYAIGLMLGDGTTGSDYATIYTADDYIRDYMVREHGWTPYKYEGQVGRVTCNGGAAKSALWKDVVGRNKGADKRIDPNLLEADPDSRLACLQGLMDSDGTIETTGRCRFVSLSEHLAKGVQYLVRSLGGKASCYWENRPSAKGGVDGRWRVNVQHCNKFNPFRLPRKADRVKRMIGVDRRIESIVQIADGPATCFEVAHASHLFVCQDFVVTHNTITLLMDFAQEVGKGYGKSWRGILFRLEFGDLDDVVKKIEEWFYVLWPGQFQFLKSKSDYTAVWSTGEALLLRNLPDESAYDSYHGHEYPWIGFEELTQWVDDKAYKLMMSCCRSAVPGIPCRIRSTTNPHGSGHTWVKKRFKLPQMRGRVIRVPGEMPRIAIHGHLKENFLVLHNQPNYPMIIRQAAMNKAQEQAWMEADWTVTAGGLIDDLWNPDIHVLPNIPANKIPRSWRITRAYDHGQSHPFAVGWWLESSGEPIVINGRRIGSVRGDVILWSEWYGTAGTPEKGTNVGIRMPARKIAQGILDREEDLGVLGRVLPGPADTEIYSKDQRGTGRSPADDMEEMNVTWERADKTPGSRSRGWQMIRSRLTDAFAEDDGTRSKPGLFVCERCVFWIELVPPTPRDRVDQDDNPKNYEDHLSDMTRYRLSWEMPLAWQFTF